MKTIRITTQAEAVVTEEWDLSVPDNWEPPAGEGWMMDLINESDVDVSSPVELLEVRDVGVHDEQNRHALGWEYPTS
jgi:hypothetical protein